MLKSSSCKYLFVLILSIGFAWIECEQVASSASSGTVEGKSSKDIDLLINRLMDETSALQQQQKSTEQKLLHQQRLELLRNVLDAASARSDEDESASVVDGELYDDDDDLASEEELSKRSRPQKKDSQQLRRQAARWDIGFGKRVPHASQTKSKAFMDALYGKRSSGVHYRMPYNARTSYGRRQQWDLQYGRK